VRRAHRVVLAGKVIAPSVVGAYAVLGGHALKIAHRVGVVLFRAWTDG
jgi:hypothetical protein